MKLTKRNIGDWVTQKEWLNAYQVLQISTDKQYVYVVNGNFNMGFVPNKEFIVVKKKEKKK